MQELKLNLEPYFDDFDKDSNYHRVLFKPGTPIQSRELTTLQSILQNQIERFGQHTFKDGSVVIPGQVGYNLQYSAVLIQPLISGIQVENLRESLVGKTLRGVSSNVKAKVINTISASESEKSSITFYVKYVSSGNIVNNVQLTKFTNNEILVDENNNQVAVTSIQNATSYTGSVAYITPGVYFIRGFFVEVLEQYVILDQYSNFPSYKIGLSVSESIVTAQEDTTLYDNSVGSSNFTAPGADRLKIEAKLIKQDINFGSDASFIELLRLDSGKNNKLLDNPINSIYNELEKNLARRTYDESGNYSLVDFDVKVKETYDDGENAGVYSLNSTSDIDKIVLNRTPTASDKDSIDGRQYYTVEVSPGKAYVKGFEVNSSTKKYLTIEKPRKSLSLNNQGLVSNFGSYFVLDTVSGTVSPGTVVTLKNVVGGNDVSIGKARAVALISGKKLFVADVTLYSVITLSESSTDLVAGDFVFFNTGSQSVVESVSTNVVTLRQVSGNIFSGLTFTNSRNSVTHTVSTVVNNKIENITKITSSGNLSANVALESVAISGSSFSVTSNSLSGIGTNFNSEVSVAMKLQIGTSIVIASAVNSSTVTTGTIANGTYYNVKKLVPKLKVYNNNYYSKIIDTPVKSANDFTYYKTLTENRTVNNGNVILSSTSNVTLSASDIIVTNSSGIVNFDVTSNSSSSVTLTFNSSLNATTVDITYKVRVNNPTLKTKSVAEFKFLKISNEKTSSNTIYGTRKIDKEISLKFTDVYKIHAIHEADASTTSNDKLFDKITLNNVTNLVVGNIIVYENIKAKIVSISGSTLSVIYLSNNKFNDGTNLNYLVQIIADMPIIGRYIVSVENGKYKDITDNFTLVKNDGAEFYNISKLIRLDGRPTPTNQFIVVFDYFQHSNTTNDFYSISSYDTSEIDYEDITRTYDGTPYSDIVDFRYETIASTASGGTITTPYTETQSAFDYYTVTRSMNVFAFPGEVVGLDYDYYLGRVDKIFLDSSNKLLVTKGAESLNPVPPQNIEQALLLATITIPPYMKNVNSSIISFENNRRYTMKDIGSLEKRLENIETYTSLNLLEVNTNSLTILDDQGNSRFKNGFIADNFKTTSFADLNNPNYSASIDTNKSLVRPYPYVNNIGFNYSSSSTTTKKGDLVTLPYTEIVYVNQKYASRVENLQPFEMVNWFGTIQLNPSKDIWYDTIKKQGQTQQIDLSQPIKFLFDRSGASGDQWGSWQTTGSSRTGGGTLIDLERTGVNNSFRSLTQDIQVGDTLNNITAEKYLRSRIIEIYVDKLKPNTYHHFFIDGKISNDVIFPKNIMGMTNRTGTFVVGEKVSLRPRATGLGPIPGATTPTIVQGTVISSSSGTYSSTSTYLSIDGVNTIDGSQINPTLINSEFDIIGQTSNARGSVSLTAPRISSNNAGTLEGFLIIPPTTYESGDTVFLLTDDISGNTIPGISDSNAQIIFSNQGTKIELTSNVVSLTSASIVSTPIRATNQIFIADPPPPARRHDPIAQSFFVDEEGGIFVSSIDLYFQTKDSSVPVTVDIRTMENGNITDNIVPYSTVTVKSDSVNISTNASAVTKFTFSSLVYLNEGVDYAFVVRSISKNYKIWISRLSENDVATGFTIDKQPYSGSLFKSQNMSTWTPVQFDDVKFVLNRAKFITGTTYTCTLNNTPVSSINLGIDSLTFTAGSSLVEIYHPNHGMNTIQNYVTISAVTSNAASTTLNSSITSGTSSGNITVGDASSTVWTTVNGSLVSASNPGYILIEEEIIKYTAVSGNTLTIPTDGRGQFNTIAAAHSLGSSLYCYQINGIPLNQINKTHKINQVIDLDRYKISAVAVANSTLISGGPSINATRNIAYEELTPRLNLLNIASTETSIGFESVRGNSIYESPTSFSLLSEEPIQNLQTTELSIPRIITSTPNTTNYLSSNPYSLKCNVKFSTTKDNVSPILDVAGSSFITISNRIFKKTTNGVLDISSEFTPRSGKYSSYICKKVTLQNASTSIKVLFDAVRKPGFNGQYSDIKVFAKLSGDTTLGNFNDMNYIEIPSVIYPISTNSSDYKAFDFEIKNLSEFKECAIKIVMISPDQTNVPRIRNFRAIALAV
jgi:hypothetical protein